MKELKQISVEDEPFYTSERLISVHPSEWADGYAKALTQPHSYYNETLAHVLGAVLLREEGITRLGMAEVLAELEGITEIDSRLLDRVERTRKRLDQIIPGLIVQTGKGAHALMTLDKKCFEQIKLSKDQERDAKDYARRFTQERVNNLFRVTLNALVADFKGKYNLSDFEVSAFQSILRSGRKGYEPYTGMGVKSFMLGPIHSLIAKLPPEMLYEKGSRTFACESLLNALGENVEDYRSMQERIESPDGPYPLPILHSNPAPVPPPVPQKTRTFSAPQLSHCVQTDIPPEDLTTLSLAELHRRYPWYITVYPHVGSEGGCISDAQIADLRRRPKAAQKVKAPSPSPDSRSRLADPKVARRSLDDLDGDFERYLGRKKGAARK